jgi:hypothetical protein
VTCFRKLRRHVAETILVASSFVTAVAAGGEAPPIIQPGAPDGTTPGQRADPDPHRWGGAVLELGRVSSRVSSPRRRPPSTAPRPRPQPPHHLPISALAERRTTLHAEGLPFCPLDQGDTMCRTERKTLSLRKDG